MTGVFRSEPRVSMQRLAAALAGAAESTQVMPSAGTEVTPVGASVSSRRARGGAQDSPSSPSLSFAPGSSWSGKSSLRYQREIARIGAQVADALDYAHKRKVIHRDIKPHNILLDALGNAWITDFGLAKLKQEENQSTSQAFAGTLRYMAPERLQGKSDGRDDVYALGATLYEFLALRPLFDASDPHQLLSKIEHNPPTPLRQIDRQIHPDLAAVIARPWPRTRPTGTRPRPSCRRAAPVHGGPAGQDAARARRMHNSGGGASEIPGWPPPNITAAAVTTILAIGMTLAARYYRDNSQISWPRRWKTSAIRARRREQLFKSQSSELAPAGSAIALGSGSTRWTHSEGGEVGRELGYLPQRFDRLRDEAMPAWHCRT